MKFYEFYKNNLEVDDKDHFPFSEIVGTKHQYLAHGIVIFHTMEYQGETEDLGDGTRVIDAGKHTLEEEHFIPYHAFDRIEITEVGDV